MKTLETGVYQPMTTTICDFTGLGDDFARLELTTDHPCSSYGQPVLVDNFGHAYGRDDVVLSVSGRNGGRGTTAYQLVAGEARLDDALRDDELVRRFLRDG